jgi:hypothetical protein
LADIVPVWENHLPDSPEWDDVLFGLSRRPDQAETVRWAAAQLGGASVRQRQFMSYLVHIMSFNRADADPEVREALRARLGAETDPHALDQVIGAFAGYCHDWKPATPVDLSEILPLGRHDDRMIRGRVASELLLALGDPAGVPDGGAAHTVLVPGRRHAASGRADRAPHGRGARRPAGGRGRPGGTRRSARPGGVRADGRCRAA